MSETTALEGVWVLGWPAGQVESMADGGSQSEHREVEMPPNAVCLLASLCLSMEQLVVVVLHLIMLQAACASLEVLNISGLISFLTFMFKSRAARWEGRVILQYNQLLYVNVILKKARGCVGKAEPLCWSAAASAPAICPSACLALSSWGVGHHLGWLGETF